MHMDCVSAFLAIHVNDLSAVGSRWLALCDTQLISIARRILAGSLVILPFVFTRKVYIWIIPWVP